MPYVFQSFVQNLSTLATTSGGAALTEPVATSCLSRPGCGTIPMSGGLPALARTRTCASKDLSPSYLIVAPVHFSNGL